MFSWIAKDLAEWIAIIEYFVLTLIIIHNDHNVCIFSKNNDNLVFIKQTQLWLQKLLENLNNQQTKPSKERKKQKTQNGRFSHLEVDYTNLWRFESSGFSSHEWRHLRSTFSGTVKLWPTQDCSDLGGLVFGVWSFIFFLVWQTEIKQNVLKRRGGDGFSWNILGKKMIEAPKKIYRWGWKGRDIMRPSRWVAVFCFFCVCSTFSPVDVSHTHCWSMDAHMSKEIVFPRKMFDDFILQCSCVSR